MFSRRTIPCVAAFWEIAAFVASRFALAFGSVEAANVGITLVPTIAATNAMEIAFFDHFFE